MWIHVLIIVDSDCAVGFKQQEDVNVRGVLVYRIKYNPAHNY